MLFEHESPRVAGRFVLVLAELMTVSELSAALAKETVNQALVPSSNRQLSFVPEMGNAVFQEGVGQCRTSIVSPARSLVDDIPARSIEHRGVRRVEVLHLAFGLGLYLRRCSRVTVRVINLSQPPVGTVNLAFVSVLLDTKYLVSGRHGTILADEVSRCDLAVT